MTIFEVRECTNPACRLRMPLDPGIYSGTYCPRCSAQMDLVVESHQNYDCVPQSEMPIRKLEVILDNVRSAYNVGAIFRTADGVGVAKVHLCGITPVPTHNPSMSKTALGAEAVVPWTCHPNAYHLGGDLRDKGYQLLALECTPQSIPIYRFQSDPAESQPIALIVGNEKAGIDPDLIKLCDAVLMLPMVGRKSSLNVAVAFGVAAYWLLFG